MLKFFRKYELQFQILATAVWLFAAIEKIFLQDDPGKKNWNLFIGIIFGFLAIFYFFEVIELVKNRKRAR
jgi:hypothetical protein